MRNKVHSQFDRFTIRGHWWLPNDTSKVAGDIRYTEEDLSLRLFGGLNEARVESPFRTIPFSTEFPLILGETLEGAPVTLLKSFYTKWRSNIRSLNVRPGAVTSIRSSRLNCAFLLNGIHLSTPVETFAKSRIEIPSLEDWLGENPFQAEVGDGGKTIRLEYTRPDIREYKIEATSIRLGMTSAGKPPAVPLGGSPKIEHHTYIEVAPQEPKPIDWFIRMEAAFTGMLAILYGGRLASRRIMLFKDPNGSDQLSLYYPRHGVKFKPYEQMDFLLRFEHVRPTFEALVANWLGASDASTRAARIVLSNERKPSRFIEGRFLPLMQAVETLTNEGPTSSILSPHEYESVKKQLLQALPEGLPDEFVLSIKQSIGHSNGRALRHKLLAMARNFEDETCKLFCIDRNAFIKGIVDTRNYLAHYSNPKDRKILQGIELHWAIQKLSLMLRLTLLKSAGIPEATLRSAIKSHHRLSKERRAWEKVSEEGTVVADLDEI